MVLSVVVWEYIKVFLRKNCLKTLNIREKCCNVFVYNLVFPKGFKEIWSFRESCYEMLWTLTIFILFYFILFFWFYINFVCFFFFFFFWTIKRHMTCHMMWHHRPRTWWKNLEDDVRTHVYNMVALSRK